MIWNTIKENVKAKYILYRRNVYFSAMEHSKIRLGMCQPTKTDKFLEKFQGAFDPPPHFRIILHFFVQNGYIPSKIDGSMVAYMSQLLLLGKFEYGGGPIFKVVLEC